jgi:hypothetical protein
VAFAGCDVWLAQCPLGCGGGGVRALARANCEALPRMFAHVAAMEVGEKSGWPRYRQ